MARPMVFGNYDAMSDQDLLDAYEKAKIGLEEQYRIDPDGKALLGTAKKNVQGIEDQLAKRGLKTDGISADTGSGVTSSKTTKNINANKKIPLVEEYDTGNTAAKVAGNETVDGSGPGTVQPPKQVSQRRIDALEAMAESGTDAEKEVARKKLEEIRGRQPGGRISVGTPVDGATTTPSPKGTTPSSPRVTPSGTTTSGPRPTINVQPEVSPPGQAMARISKTAADDAAEAAVDVTKNLAGSTARKGAGELGELSRLITKGPGGAIAAGIVGAGVLFGIGMNNSKNKKNRSYTSAEMNAQQRYGR